MQISHHITCQWISDIVNVLLLCKIGLMKENNQISTE